MSEIYGWTGRILKVDLTRGKTEMVDSLDYVHKYLGGKGMNHRLAWEEIPPGTKAFDPENRLIISVGPLTGTPAQASGRATVSGVAAQSYPEMYSHSGVGGWVPPAIKYAGFDGIIIHGRAPKPCYLYIEENKAKIKQAGDLWGLGNYDTQKKLKQRHGEETRILCIGPAGENMSRIAVLLTDTENAAGQGGFGGVAGSKNLKAICIRASGEVKIARPDLLLKLRRENSHPKEFVPIIDKGSWDYDGHTLNDVPYSRNKVSCSHSCDRHCWWMFHDVPRVTRPGLHSGKWMCIGRFTVGWQRPMGVNWPLWQQGLRAGFEITELLNQYGLNEWEILGGMVPWLVMADREGVLSREDFREILPITPDRPEWWVKLIKAVTYRQGIGDLLAEGTYRTIQQLGTGRYGDTIYHGIRKIPTKISLHAAWGYAGHWSGRGIHSVLEFPDYLIQALTWMTATRDPEDDTHIRAKDQWMNAFRKDPYNGPWGPRIAIWNEHRSELKSSLTLCDTIFPDTNRTDLESRLFAAVTGIEYTEKELDKIGERLKNMQRALLIRNYDRDRKQELAAIMPWFKRPDGTKGIQVDGSKFDRMTDEYYRQRGWQSRTGRPTKKKLEDLGLADVAGELHRQGKIAS